MKYNMIAASLAGAVALAMSSCVGGASSWEGTTVGSSSFVSSRSKWSSARYDAAGFPIYGYDGGRAVYGYHSSGAAIFSPSLLAAGCRVPSWAPASWYRGQYQYPCAVRRCSVPVRCPYPHYPSRRPHHSSCSPYDHHAHGKWGGRPDCCDFGSSAHGFHPPNRVGDRSAQRWKAAGHARGDHRHEHRGGHASMLPDRQHGRDDCGAMHRGPVSIPYVSDIRPDKPGNISILRQ